MVASTTGRARVRRWTRTWTTALALGAAPLPAAAAPERPSGLAAPGPSTPAAMGGLTRTWLEALHADPFDPVAAERLLAVAPAAGELPQVLAELARRGEAGGEIARLGAAAVRARLARAVVLKAVGEHAAALEVLAGLEATRPPRERWQVAALEAECRAATGQRAEAIAAYERAIGGAEGGSERAEAMAERALGLAVSARDGARVEAFAERLSGGSAAVRMRAAAALAEVGAVARAEALWRTLVREASVATGEAVPRWQGLAGLLERDGRADEAARVWDEALERLPGGHPDRALAWHERVAVARRSGLLSSVTERVRAAGARDDEALLALARLEDELGLDATAVGTWREAVRRMPKREAAHEGLIAALGRAGETDALVAAWEALVKVAPGEPRHQLARVDALMGLGKTAEATGALRAIARAAGGDPSLLTAVIGRWLRVAKPSDRKEIEGLYRELRRSEPDEVGHVVAHGGYLWSLGDKAGALAVWGEVRRTGGGVAKMAEILLDHGLLDEAQGVLDGAGTVGAEGPDVLRARALLAEKRKRDQEAARHWLGVARGAREGSALAGEARERLLGLWKSAHLLETRARELAQGLGGGAPEATALVDGRLAVEAFLLAGLASEARAVLSQLAKGGAGGTALTQLQEQLALRDGDRAAAAGFAEALALADRARATRHYQRAVEHARAGADPARAMALARAAVALSPSEAQAHLLLGDVAAAAGRNAEAVAAWRRARELDSGETEALFRLAALARTEGARAEEAGWLLAALPEARESGVLERAVRRLVAILEARGEDLTPSLRGSIEAAVDGAAARGPHRDGAAAVLVGHFEREVLRRETSRADEVAREALARRAQPVLLVALGGVDEAARDQALRVLERLRPAGAVAGLARLAERAAVTPGTPPPGPAHQASGDVIAAGRALAALGHIGTPDARAALLRLLPGMPPRLREVAAWALGRSGPWPDMVGWMGAGIRERMLAGFAATRAPSAASLPVFERLLEDGAPEPREVALRGLGLMLGAPAEAIGGADVARGAARLLGRTLNDTRNHRPELLGALIEACASPVAEPGARDLLREAAVGQLWSGPVDDEALLGIVTRLSTAPDAGAWAARARAFAATHDAMFRPSSATVQWTGPVRLAAAAAASDGAAPWAPETKAAVGRRLAAVLGRGRPDPRPDEAVVLRAARSLINVPDLAGAEPGEDPATDALEITLSRLIRAPHPFAGRAAALRWLSRLDPAQAARLLTETGPGAACEGWQEAVALPLAAGLVPAAMTAPDAACLAVLSPPERELIGRAAGATPVEAETLASWLGTADRALRAGLLETLAGTRGTSDGLTQRLVELALGPDLHLAELAARAARALGLPSEAITAIARSPHAAVRAAVAPRPPGT